MVPFYYDGLLRRPVAIEDAIDPQRARRQGIREVPPTPSRPPDVAELRSCRGELVRILRALRDGRDQESELLAIRGFDRRDRHYRPALAMLFVPDRGGSSPQLAIAIDGEQSIDHEAAFSSGGQLERLGLERALRSRRRGSLPLRGPKELRERRNAEAERRPASASPVPRPHSMEVALTTPPRPSFVRHGRSSAGSHRAS